MSASGSEATPLPRMDPGVWMAIGSAVAFAAKAIFVKLAYREGLDPVGLLALRMTLAAPVFATMALQRGPFPRGLELLKLVALGTLGYYLSALLDFGGLQHITAGLERLVLFLYPSLVMLLSVFFLGRKVQRKDLVALALGYLGLVLAVGHDLRLGDPQEVATGVAMVFTSAFTYAVYLMATEKMVGNQSGIRVSSWAATFSAVELDLHYLLTRPVAPLLQLSGRSWGLVVALTLVSTLLPVLLLAEAIRRIGASRSSALASLGPVVTLGLGWAVLGEPLSALQGVGAALVVAGVMLVSRRS